MFGNSFMATESTSYMVRDLTVDRRHFLNLVFHNIRTGPMHFFLFISFHYF